MATFTLPNPTWQFALTDSISCRSLFSLLLLAFALLAAQPGRAQDVSTYQFAASSGTFVPITTAMGATTIPNIATFSAVSPALSLQMPFYYGGTLFSSVKACSFGYLDFNGSNSPSFNNALSNSGQKNLIAPFWDGLDGTVGTASYLTSGTAPNRVFTFQWLNWKADYNDVAANLSFQVKLYESTNIIQFIYRPEAGAFSGNSSASIGINGGTDQAGDTGSRRYNYLSLSNASANPVASNVSVFSVNTINSRPANGQIYTFTPINDYCGHATPLVYGGTVVGNSVGASMQGDPSSVCTIGNLTPSQSPGIFYTFVGNGQTATVSTCAGATAAFGDTKLFVYSGACGSFTCVGSNDNLLAAGCGTNPQASAVTFQTVTGTSYYVFVQYTAGGGQIGVSLNGTGLATRSAIGAGSLELFPNPTSHAFTLRLPALGTERTAQLTLLNNLGQTVQTRSLELRPGGTDAQVDVSALAAGLYTVRVQAGSQMAAQQVVVE